MASHAHDIILGAVDEQPSLVLHFMRLVGEHISDDTTIEPSNGTLLASPPVELRPDRLLLTHAKGGDPPVAVLEVQTSKDPQKRWSWPAYAAQARLREKREAIVLVVCIDEDLAVWAEELIRKESDWMHHVRLLGPSRIPRVEDARAVRENPWLAVVSALSHRTTAEDAKVLHAVHEGLPASGLPDKLVWYALRVIDEGTAAVAAAALEALMQIPEDFKPEETKAYRRWIDRGLYMERAEGLRSMRSALRKVLASHGLHPNEAEAATIDACNDLEVLESWIERTGTATSVSEVIRQ